MWLLWMIAGCAQPHLCRATGGAWDGECFSCSSNPVCSDGEAVHLPCMAVCGEGCRCPDDAPVWDDALGCLPASVCAERSG